jgi:hypothetical protein
MTKCWRCERTDTERRDVEVQTRDMPYPKLLEECVNRMDCVATRFHDRKPGPGVEMAGLIRNSSLGVALREIYKDEYRKHRDCDPPCLDLKQAAEHLIASGVNPAEVGS